MKPIFLAAIFFLIISSLIFLLLSKITLDSQKFIENSPNSNSINTSNKTKEVFNSQKQKSTSSEFFPPNFRGPVGEPKIIGPSGPPPNY